MKNGKVKWFNHTKGFGFILEIETEKEFFVHKTSLERAGIRGLEEGQLVTFEVANDGKGRDAAVNLKLVN